MPVKKSKTSVMGGARGGKVSKRVKKSQPKVQTFRLNELRPAEYNPRTISDEAMAGLTASIKKFGCVEPVIVNIRSDRNIIVGGNQRFKALAAAGIKECVCITVDLDEGQEKTLNTKTASKKQW